MAYQTYITEALVCGSWHRNTSDKSFLLFAREAGMVYASARSVRKEHSKQRYALQEFSHIRASLVSGKAGWRIAGVESYANTYWTAGTREARTVVRNIVRLLRRVAGGETVNQGLFDDIIDTLHRANDFDHKKLELLLSLRILHSLGYISPEEAILPLIESEHAYDNIALLDEKTQKMCESAVAHALLQSQL